MGQIKDTNVIKTPEVTVAPSFFLPDGVVDIRVKTQRNENAVGDGTEIDFEFDADETTIVDDTEPGDDDTPSGQLTAPQFFEVVEQKIRVAPDGRTVVDVTVEVEDIPGAINYELRLST